MERLNGKMLAVLFALILAHAPSVQAKEDTILDPPSEISAETAAPPVKVRTPEEDKKIKEMRKRSAEKRKDLNGSSWEVTFVSSSDAKLKGKKDTFVFQDGQFKSEAFSKRGFGMTNYTITVPPDETSPVGVWETMQTAKEGQIFVRGEWQGEKMSGSITEQLDGGKKVLDHSFTTEARKKIPPSSKETDKNEAVVEPAEDEGSETVPPGSALVSKEGPRPVAPFEPGTTEEIQ